MMFYKNGGYTGNFGNSDQRYPNGFDIFGVISW